MSSPRVGMAGAGQLARMTHQAGIPLGIDLVVLAVDEADSAVGASGETRFGSPDDPSAIEALASEVDVLTFDHEGVPNDLIAGLEAKGFLIRPGSAAKRFAQDKLYARRQLRTVGFPVPEFAEVSRASELEELGQRWGWPVVLKAPTGGYDGRGVTMVGEGEGEAALAGRPGPWLVEPQVSIERELSQIVARRPGGQVALYPLAETFQEDGICVEVRAPARVEEWVAQESAEIARSLADEIDAVGVMAVELFLTPDDRILINELSLRPHNSGHFTIEGCPVSQFENHLRAVLDWPLGSTEMRVPAVVMTNLLGTGLHDPRESLVAALEVEGAHPHLYRKHPRAGRKLGHVTAVGQSISAAGIRSRRCADLLATGVAR